jgi:hypothetical protein
MLPMDDDDDDDGCNDHNDQFVFLDEGADIRGEVRGTLNQGNSLEKRGRD